MFNYINNFYLKNMTKYRDILLVLDMGSNPNRRTQLFKSSIYVKVLFYTYRF